MDTGQTRRDRVRRGVPAAVMAGALTVAALAGGAGQAVAAQHRTATHTASPAVAGDISTIAGGVGGPARGTNVSLREPAACPTAVARCTSPTGSRCSG
jgi:hypothetical protein